MAPPTPTPNTFAAMRNFGGMVSSALSFGDGSRQVSSLGLGTPSMREPSGTASPPCSASPVAASPVAASPVASSPVAIAGPPGGYPPFSIPRRRTPTFRPDSDYNDVHSDDDDPDEGRAVVEEEGRLEEYSDDDTREVVSVEDGEVDGPESVPVLPPAQVVGQKRPRSLSSSSSCSSSSSGVLPPPANAIAAAAAAAARPVAAARPAAAAAVAAPLPSPRGEPSPKRVNRSLREEEYLWEKVKSEPGRWVVLGVDEACDRCHRRPSAPPTTPATAPVTPPSAPKKTPKSSLKKSKGKGKEKGVTFNDGAVGDESTHRAGPSAPRLSFFHPQISLDVCIPEDEKEFATYCSLVLGLTTQLEAARHDTALLLDFSTRQANALNNLTAALVDVVNIGDVNKEARTSRCLPKTLRHPPPRQSYGV
ncbi:hypothetical protein TREMEDRAFT_66450 [Tremella mesenterica DSM 1558]|uniref:uncharacterized protein n=1 Tax=Tremella mesenterica (strain ATCC 24925 / CBS 8224 / DSM 1558 / NBRC 9311 / NRRL Y-6157 / RJB 2259-6 / UBC 559-6) TaxID=578456 RepID=UPI00032C9CEE|nr:uncharacterized protein TREMEDRAFT_66450 [Tremella mesenterica DSM 1558]EIW65538.1 hypothetical protein TREMEDRAFT_66450 [Tremella mesenterica DSM 1558]